MSTQPEALRLADALESAVVYGDTDTQAAAALRRQHAEIEALKLENNNLRWLSMRMTPGKAEEVKP